MRQSTYNPNDSHRGKPMRPDSHIADEFLLLSIDGELPAADREIVNAHIAVCWSCRARKERFEQSVREVVEYRDARTSPYLPPPSSGPALFRTRLDRQAAELGRPSFFAHWASQLFHPVKGPTFYRAGWIAAAVVVAFGFLAVQIHRWRSVQVVSAAEFLRKAEQEQAQTLKVASKPIVCQRVRIQINGKAAVTRTIYRDPARQRRVVRIDQNASEEASTKKAFNATPFDWDDPLSPVRFDQWRDRLGGHHDAVLRVGTDLLTLRTVTSEGLVGEATLTVRSFDYHPISESLRLRDDRRIEIAELSYEVVGLDTLDPAIFGSPLKASAAPLSSAMTTPPVPPSPTETELAAVELEVRAALHRIGADLGEQVEIEETPTHHIAVTGLAADDTRKQEIQSALAGIALVEAKVRTVAEATAEEQSSLPPAGSLGRVSTRSVESTPLLDKQLRERFTADDARAAFVNQSLALSQSASARAWALRRLADRYTTDKLALLDRVSRERLEELLSDHIAALQQDISRLRNQLGMVMSPGSNTTAANTNPTEMRESPRKEAQAQPEDWRARVRRIHSSVETANECVAVLLGGAATEGESAEKLELRLRTTLTGLQAELETLGHEVHRQL